MFSVLTLLQRNEGLTFAEAEAKVRAEIARAESDYLAAARAVFEHPDLGQRDDIRRMVLNILYGMGGNLWWSLVVSILAPTRACEGSDSVSNCRRSGTTSTLSTTRCPRWR